MQQYRINYGLLISMTIGLLVILAATFVVHRYQLSRNADAARRLRRERQQEGDLKSAAADFRNYLSIRPDDKDVEVKLANVWIDVTEQPIVDPEDWGNSISYLEDVVRKLPEEKEVRKQLVSLYGRIGQVQPALDHLALAIQQSPDDVELHLEQMRYLLRAQKIDGPDGALAKCKKLIGYDDKTDKFDAKKAIAPHEPSAYANCAALLRTTQDKPELADRVMDQLIEENPELAAAYLQRGQYYVSIGEPSRGQRDIDQAYKLAPKDADVLLAKAGRAEANSRRDRALQYLEAGKQEHPEDGNFYLALSRLDMQDKKYEEAQQILEEGLKAVPSKESPELLFALADLQLRANDVAGLRQTQEDMRKAGMNKLFLQWIDAYVLLAQHEYYAASELLSDLQSQIGESGRLADQLGMQLGVAYEQSGQLDKAESTYRRLLQQNVNNEPAKAGVQRVAERLNRRSKNPGTDDLDQQLAEILKLPKDQQDWSAMDEKLKKLAEEREYEGATLDLFWARIMLARGDYAQARKYLADGYQKDAENLGIQRWAVILQRSDPSQGPEKALHLLDQVVEKFGDKPELRLDRADCFIAVNEKKQDDETLKKELTELGEKIPADWSESEQSTFWSGMAGRYLALGQRDEAKACFERVAALQPNQLPIRMALFQLALDANDDVAMKEAQDQILKVVGSKEDSNLLYTEAWRRLVLYRRGEPDKEALKNIRRLVDRTLKDRPDWFELQLLNAEVALLENDQDAALASFEKAQELGRPNGRAVLQHAQLLLNRGRFKDAKELIEQLPKTVREVNLGKNYAEVLLKTGDVEDAVKVINKYSEADPEDADRQLVLGRTLVTAASSSDLSEARRKELMSQADTALHKAAKLAPESPQVWMALITLQVMQKDLEGAKSTLQQARLALPEDQLVGVLLKSNEILGQWFNAENIYLTALNAQPDNLLLTQQLAEFYLSRVYPRKDKVVKAIPLINRILRAGADGKLESDDPTLMWARRTAARILAGTGDYQKLLKAEKLLASNSIDGKLGAEDRLQMAEILAVRPDPISRRKAKNLFEQLKKDQQQLELKDELLLGQLYAALGEWERCKAQMLRTVSRFQKSVDARVQFITLLLQHGNANDLEMVARRGGQLETLQKLAPTDIRTVQLMAAVGGKTGKDAAVRKYLLGTLPKIDDPSKLDKQQLQWMQIVASLLTDIGDMDDAEKVYRQVAAVDPSQALVLAEFLGKHRDVDQCMKVLDSVYKPERAGDISRVAIGVVAARRDQVGDKYDEQVQHWLDRGLLENPDSVQLLMLQAEFDDAKKKYDEAAEIYTKLLARKDVTGFTRAIVLNNLAYLVSLAGNAADVGVDPLKLVQEASQILGPTADILDTRAVIYTTRGEYQKAIRDLDNSLTDNPTAAKYFHKAVAHLGAGENSAALKAWDDAHQASKDVRSTLNRMEYENYDQTKGKIEAIRNQSQSLTRAAS